MGIKTTTTTTTRGDHGDDILFLSEDVLIQEILVCLPVKSLLRFKSVCKSWRQLIQTPFFIDLHTTTTTFINSSSSSSKFGTFILQTYAYEPSVGSYGYEVKLFMFTSDSGDHGDGDGDGEEDDNNNDEDDQKKKKKMVFKLDDLGFLPFYRDFQLKDRLRMVGSCNGIICLHDPELMNASKGDRHRQHYSNLRDVCLWNPATRQFRILPKSRPIQEGKEDFIGFGFDVNTKDYKVLRITPYSPRDASTARRKDGGCMCRVQVYSLSTDSWRLLEGIHYLPVVPTQDPFDNHGIYLNGSYFFVGRKRYADGMRDDFMLLSFDFTKEIFTTMQLPDDNTSSFLTYLGDKMAVFTTPLRDDLAVFRTPQIDDPNGGYCHYDIWVLNEQQGNSHGVLNKESWTKLHSFRIKRGGPYTKPRCISNNGEFALISSRSNDGSWRNKLQLFNLVTREAIKDFTIGDWKCRVSVYKESLVSIMGGGNVLLRWQLPTHGTTYKLNLDAPFIDSNFRFGIGLCLTSDTGGCIGVRSLRRLAKDAEEGEVLAMLEAIKWAKKLELSPIIIESDSKNCLSFFMDDDHDNNSTHWSSGALSLLKEAKLLLNSSEIGSISLKYCSRSCNNVTDIAAKLGREGSWICMEWTANSPGEIVRSLSKELGRKTW